ncbi:MAG: bifunctional riboflavin kinase/FMN adenylyltransferase, partial [Planctomycetes bacterium]|nr:bifunctional riboflavin kinase/FMN adenylyltransferase [Planctomycetota bacterium]
MKIIHSIEADELPIGRSVLTIGNFDGVHRAHQQLIAQAGLLAANTGGPVVVLTFEPHPLSIVAPERAPERLQSLDEKIECLAQAGADIVVIARSDRALLGLTAEEFVENVIRKRFNPTHIVEGPSFGFGRGRRGTPQRLAELAGAFGCEVLIVEPVMLRLNEGESLLVSSSLIRKLVSEGKVHRAALCLGRPFTLGGTVVEGDRRGRSLGFPTANLDVQDQLLPADGVYAGHTTIDTEQFLCGISVGRRPTFDERTH